MASVAVSGYLAACLIFLGIGLLVKDKLCALTRWDARVARGFADNRTGSLNDWTAYVTRVADTLGILVVLGVALIVLFFVLRLRWEALILVLALCLELTTFLTINFVVARDRPDVIRLGSLPSTSSFPSGHTAAIVALYGGLAMIINSRIRSRIIGFLFYLVVLVMALAVGYGRVYRGMHFPSDAIAGALLGLTVLVIAVAAVRSGQLATAERARLRSSARSFESPVSK